MGLFNFLRNKPKNKPNPAQPFSETQHLVLTAMDMLLGDESVDNVRKTLEEKGLENKQVELILRKAIEMNEKHFNKASDAKSGVIESMHISNEPIENSNKTMSINDMYAQHLQPNNEIEREILAVINRGHGDNYGGLLGYDFLKMENGLTIIDQLTEIAITKLAIFENPIYKVCETNFTDLGGNTSNVKVRVVYIKKSVLTSNAVLDSFPYIYTDKVIPFQTKKIFHWSDSANLEADIQGGGRDTFGLSFYATDYAINKEKYKTNKTLNIKVSALALVLDISSITEINGTPVVPDFCTYIPNKDFVSKTYFDFVGKLLDFEKVTLNEILQGYMLTVKLINHETIDNFFTIDIFVNERNMRFKELKYGMKLTGLLWFQGEIA